MGEPAPQAGVPLAPLTTLGVGGPARWCTRASDAAAVDAAHRWSMAHDVPLLVLGGGSNVLVADGPLDAHVLLMAASGIEVEEADGDTRLHVAAGTPWTAVVDLAVARGLAGVECLAGIPGSAGGTPIQNVGAYGQEVAPVIETVVALDRRDGRMVRLAAAECGFGYRRSRFRGADAGRFVIVEVVYRLRPGPATVAYADLARRFAGAPAPGLAEVREAVLAIRRGKGMVLDAADPETRSVGSFFVNPTVEASAFARLQADHPDAPGYPQAAGGVKVPAAWLIERAGFERGHAAGRVGLSRKHPLAIVARDGATAGEVVALAARIKHRVAGRFGIALAPEPTLVGFGDDPDAAYLRG